MGSRMLLTPRNNFISRRISCAPGAGFVLLLVAILYLQCTESYEHPEERQNWVTHGRDIYNSRSASCEHKISKKSVRNLSLKWEFFANGDVSATPAISDGVVYFPSWNGNMYAVKQDSGALVWQKNFTTMTGILLSNVTTPVVARATPTIYEDYLLIGLYGPCIQLAINKTTGDLLWSTKLSHHPYALISMSGPAFEGFYYVGSSSLEEGFPDGCCSFQGFFFKIKITTGEVMWSIPMLPDNGGKPGGYSGVGLWGSTPPIDVKRRAVYIATGNTYTTPPNVTACEIAWRNLTNPPTPDPCLVYDNHQESMLSIDIDSGKINWATKLGGYDTWLLVCTTNPGSPNCPPIPGPDYDFGEAPMLMTIPDGKGKMKEILVAGQKSGFVWGLDAASGSIVWATAAGPGGIFGGSSWGMTNDGEKVFTNIINNGNLNFTLLPTTKVINASGWVALEAATGKIVWSAANPFGEWTTPPLTHANGVVFVGSASAQGAFLALDSQSGEILKTVKTNGTLNGGFSISDGCGFVGIGETFITTLTPTDFKHGYGVNSYCVE